MATSRHPTSEKVGEFQGIVFDYYHANARALAWREIDEKGFIDPYFVIVSEIMLQQTQVKRVEQKFAEFIHTFPTITALAEADFKTVLDVWSGLGYNRRAKYLHELAIHLKNKEFPQTIESLVQFKGVGANTAAAILVYAFNQRHVFIETNIRSVFINHFFTDKSAVSDKEILELVEVTMPKGPVRDWYWALMDYGTYLKNNGLSHLHRAKAHKKQSAFKGSMREVRSRILQLLMEHREASLEFIAEHIDDERTAEALEGLIKDRLVEQIDNEYSVAR